MCFSTKSLLLLIDCKYKLLAKGTSGNGNGHSNGSLESPPLIGDRDMEYGDVGFYSLGPLGRYLVEVPILVSQAGFSCAYLIFISENVSNVIPSISTSTWLVFILIPLFFLCTLKHLKSLGTFSIVADFANVFAYGIVYWFDFEHIHLVKFHPRTWSMDGFTFYLCIAIYCYEGAGMILSLEQSVSKDMKQNFRYLFKCAMFVVTLIYITFGVCGYLSFGPETNAIITLNLPPGTFPLLVKACLCFSLFFTYPGMSPLSDLLTLR
jgi:proton-coupled amino acid transporter